MGQGTNRVYNIISILAWLGTFAAIAAFVVILTGPEPESEDLTAMLPTAFVLPSPTPITPTLTFTPSNTPLPPTFTPTFTATNTPEPSDTPTPTITASATITDTPAPTLTPSLTFTPSVSPTLTPSHTPTGPTQTFTPTISPFPFTQREATTFIGNAANTAGCAWQGIGGQVIGLDGLEFVGDLQVRLFDASGQINVVRPIGSNSFYGQVSGFEVSTGRNQIDNGLYFVQLETRLNTVVAPRIEVRFTGDCAANVALVNFIQQRDLAGS